MSIINLKNLLLGLLAYKISGTHSLKHQRAFYFFLKLALPYIENSLVIMFNTSIETRIFPDAWKLARVIPIFKEGDRDDKSNYRPISSYQLS